MTDLLTIAGLPDGAFAEILALSERGDLGTPLAGRRRRLRGKRRGQGEGQENQGASEHAVSSVCPYSRRRLR